MSTYPIGTVKRWLESFPREAEMCSLWLHRSHGIAADVPAYTSASSCERGGYIGT